jgi:hypothetical protein
VKQVLTGSSGNYKGMKLSKLEKKIASATSTAELNQANIKNQTVAMGVITGQQAHQSALDTARINSVTGLYNAKLADYQRKEAERQQFISTYGADPNQRPKGMSKREFQKSLAGGQFSNLLTEDFKQKQLQTAAARKSLAGGGTTQAGISNLNALLEKAAQMPEGGREWAASVAATFGVDPNAVRNATQQNGWESAYRKPVTATEQATLDASKPDPVKTEESLKNLDTAIQSAETHADASGKTGIVAKTGRWLMGSSYDDYNNLVAETNTIRTNILTLATDPTIKKFFGPQMSNADVQLMTSAGTMLNPELQTPGQLKKSLKQAKDLIARARGAVQNGQKQENNVNVGSIVEKNGKKYRKVEGGWEILN